MDGLGIFLAHDPEAQSEERSQTQAKVHFQAHVNGHFQDRAESNSESNSAAHSDAPSDAQARALNPLDLLADVAIQDAARDEAAREAIATEQGSFYSKVTTNAVVLPGVNELDNINKDHDHAHVVGSKARAAIAAEGARRSKAKLKRAEMEIGKAGKAIEKSAEKAVREEAEQEKEYIAAGANKLKTAPEKLAASGIQPEDAALLASLEGEDSDTEQAISTKRRRLGKARTAQTFLVRKKFDFFGSFNYHPELLMELAKHIPIDDLVSLYAISKDFHETVNGHLRHVMKYCAAYQANESGRIFIFNLYSPLLVPDPVGRPFLGDPDLTRLVPGFKWLRMVIYREKVVRDILACTARQGHRMPKTMSLTLKKMWLTMDIATSARRAQLFHNDKYWTDNDLFNLQLFIMKLDMRFNDPIDGPGSDELRKLMLGQRTLTPLRNLLKRTQYLDYLEILELAVKYSYTAREDHQHLPILGIPANEVGKGHLEGWGLGLIHLLRPDELVLYESTRRNLRLEKYVYTMMLWGYVDHKTKEDIKVTEEEMYMSDDDQAKDKEREEAEMRDMEGGIEMMDIDDEEWETDDEDEEDEMNED